MGNAASRVARLGKSVKGRKRHALVDTEGLVLTVTAHSADIADIMDRDGVKLLLPPSTGPNMVGYRPAFGCCLAAGSLSAPSPGKAKAVG